MAADAAPAAIAAAPVSAIGFAGLAAPIAIAAPADVLGWLAGFLDWPAAPPPAVAAVTVAAVTVDRHGSRFTVRGGLDPDGVRTTGTAIDAANLATAALIETLVVAEPALVGVHAAAVDGPGGLTLLVGASGAGKSSIALHLARSGHRLFADDQILLRLDDGAAEGIALGLRPKVRQPIPPGFGQAFADFARDRIVLETDVFLALALDPTLQAPFASRRPVGAIVVLERTPADGQRLARTSASAALRRLLTETIGPPDQTAGRVAALAQLCAAVPVFHLGFSDSPAAAAALRETVPALR